MAVTYHLTERALRQHLRPFRVGELVAARPLVAGDGRMLYEVTTGQGQYLLRILEQRSSAEARFEAPLLAHLAKRGVAVPRMVPAGKRGCVVELAARQQLALFALLPGREVGVFEVTAEHARQVGRVLAAIQLAGRGLGRRRRNPSDPEHMLRLVSRCHGIPPGTALASDLQALAAEIGRHRWARELPRGIVHGALSISRARFCRGALVGVLNFEAACVAPYVFDVAAALCDWAFEHDHFVPGRAAALVAGYEEVRALKPLEKGALYDFSRFCCARLALECLHGFELRAPRRRGELYRDYRHYLCRLTALQAVGPTEFWGRVGRVGQGRPLTLPSPA